MKLDALPIAHIEDNVPHFSKHMLKLAISSKILVPAPSEVSLSKIVSPKIAVFRPFFGRKWSLTAKPSTFDPKVFFHNRKAVHLTNQKLWWEVNFRRPMKCQNFCDASGQTCNPYPISCLMFCCVSQYNHLITTNRQKGLFCATLIRGC